jgi:hypothetical protein
MAAALKTDQRMIETPGGIVEKRFPDAEWQARDGPRIFACPGGVSQFGTAGPLAADVRCPILELRLETAVLGHRRGALDDRVPEIVQVEIRDRQSVRAEDRGQGSRRVLGPIGSGLVWSYLLALAQLLDLRGAYPFRPVRKQALFAVSTEVVGHDG